MKHSKTEDLKGSKVKKEPERSETITKDETSSQLIEFRADNERKLKDAVKKVDVLEIKVKELVFIQ